jgi:hypothetical protein
MTVPQKRMLFILGLMLPYFGFVFYFALTPGSIGRAPGWVRWAMLFYFLGGIAASSFAGRLFKPKEAPKPAEEAAQVTQAARRVKKLLILYLVFFPFAMLEVFLQKELPVRFAVLGLIVPILVMIALWRWLRRPQENPSPAANWERGARSEKARVLKKKLFQVGRPETRPSQVTQSLVH